MNRLNHTSSSRISFASEASARRATTPSRNSVKREDDLFRQVARNPIPMGFFSMLSTAKKLSPL